MCWWERGCWLALIGAMALVLGTFGSVCLSLTDAVLNARVDDCRKHDREVKKAQFKLCAVLLNLGKVASIYYA